MVSSEDDHLLIDPPSFSLYNAQYFVTSTPHDIVSHDPHLNTDGEALYRFLLSQTNRIPYLQINFKGTHTETKSHFVNVVDSQGRSRPQSQTYTETVTDFDFCATVYPQQICEPLQWSVPDDVPTFRGKMVRECEMTLDSGDTHRRRATSTETKRHLAWAEKRREMGYPPWISEIEEGNDLTEVPHTLRSSKTLRQWADEYCASPKYFKEFVYEKVGLHLSFLPIFLILSQVLYNWNFSQLKTSLHSLILSTPYNGDLLITLTPHYSKIYVRSSNPLSRMLSNKWIKLLFFILLIYPIIWLFKRFHRNGGGTWEVCGCAYPLKQCVSDEHTTSSEPTKNGDVLPPYDPEVPTAGPGPSSSTSPSHSQPAIKPKTYIGTREGEWFRQWEGPITRAVLAKYQSSEPLTNVDVPLLAVELDGYNDV